MKLRRKSVRNIMEETHKSISDHFWRGMDSKQCAYYHVKLNHPIWEEVCNGLREPVKDGVANEISF